VVHEQQAGALDVLLGIENYHAALTVVAGAGILSLNIDRAIPLLRASRHVKRVEILVIGTQRVFRHADEENGSVRSEGAIDDGSGRDPNRRNDTHAAIHFIGGRLPSGHQRDVPVQRSVVCVEGIDAVVLRGNVKNVVDALVGDGYVGEVKRLGVDRIVDRECHQLSKVGGVYVQGSEDGLLGVLAGTRVVVMPCDDIGGKHRGNEQECDYTQLS